MDTPGVKAPYTAKVTAPNWCTVLMSAVAVTSSESKATPAPPGKTVFEWTQTVPTSAYLIALAAGELEAREVSARVRIWAEPSVIHLAHHEFSETEEFLSAAEKITGMPYAWGRYDVLCLPPSFPYGGMENPCLTFATPTLLAGDRSLADVIAHEIAHSWTGNLVTNHTWDHFWLNEGWTVWLERKIASAVKGPDHGKLSAQVNWKHLQDDVDRMGASNPFTRLVWPLNGQDPDEAFSSVPYEKGFNLLHYLESLVGEAAFLAFVNHYLLTFKTRTVTTGEFRDCFVEFFRETKPLPTTPTNKAKGSSTKKGKKQPVKSPVKAGGSEGESWRDEEAHEARLMALSALDWPQLFLSTGMPSYVTADTFANKLSITALDLSEKWLAYAQSYSDALLEDKPVPSQTLAGIYKHKEQDVRGWSSQQTCIFLEDLIANSDGSDDGLRPDQVFPSEFLSILDSRYAFSKSTNAEIAFRWQSLCLRCAFLPVLQQVTDFITSQGRMKFVRPLYRLLRALPAGSGAQLAVDTFEAHKDFYHPIARKMIAADLQRAADREADTERLVAAELEDGEEMEPAAVEPEAAAEASEEVSFGGTLADIVVDIPVSVDSEQPLQDPLWEVVTPLPAAETASVAIPIQSQPQPEIQTALVGPDSPEAAVAADVPNEATTVTLSSATTSSAASVDPPASPANAVPARESPAPATITATAPISAAPPTARPSQVVAVPKKRTGWNLVPLLTFGASVAFLLLAHSRRGK